MSGPYKIRYRMVRGKKEWEKAVSPEYQVVEGRKVIGRFDFQSQAEDFIQKKLEGKK